jgi:hypothetical protein
MMIDHDTNTSHWKPVPGQIMTRWAKDVTPENAWQEYPRPQMRRPEWFNLNGLWDYGISSKNQPQPPQFSGEILVPFPIESALSGVKRLLQPDELLWYQRTFYIPETWQGMRILLHFGAVDWETNVWVNGRQLAAHRGGYLPFRYDISDLIRAGENELLLSVWDPTDTFWQQRGKQVHMPKSIWYTQCSGIWQTVWLEPVPQAYIDKLKITPDLDASSIRIRISLAGSDRYSAGWHVRVYDAGTQIAEGEATSTTEEIIVPIQEPKLWSPDSPHLYDLVVETEKDQVKSYFGMRKYSLGQDEQGRLRFCLNNQPLFLFGPLDQGYWPDGLYAPPSEEAMRFDLEMIKKLGFNLLRKHVKVEPARYYYDCDRLGLIVWQDMINGGKSVGDATSFLAILFGSKRRDRNYRYSGRAAEESRQGFKRELQELIDHLYNFTCVGAWVPFNEGWGQFDANAIAEWLNLADPTRLIDHASGWFDQGKGDFLSLHVYFKNLPKTKPETNRAVVLSEFGGYSLKVPGHQWNPEAEFGYRKYPSSEDLTTAYLELLEQQLKPWIEAGLSAAIYTQTTDVESEVNGYMTYDREVKKMDFEKLQQAHQQLLGLSQPPAR